MFSPQNEKLIIDYILGALDETEELEVSQRLIRDHAFSRTYRKLLASLRPILSSRINLQEEQATRHESTGLAEKTMGFIHKMVQSQEAEKCWTVCGVETAEMLEASETQLKETVAEVLQETKAICHQENEVAGAVPEV